MLRWAARSLLPGRLRQELLYLRTHGRWPNIRNPQTFTEKVFWRKFHDRNPLHTLCTDKLRVRAYVEQRVGSNVLVPLLLETGEPEDLRALASWSNSVIKANHGWKMIEVIGAEEPSDSEKLRIIGECRKWMATSHSNVNREAHYEGIEPRILVETYVGERDRAPLDCKVHCFRQQDGTVLTATQLVADRVSSKSMSYYVPALNDARSVRDVGPNPPRLAGRHRELAQEAIRQSQALSADFDYVRVDWMLTPDRIYFSELTFTPGAGLSASMGPELDRALGKLWHLPSSCP